MKALDCEFSVACSNRIRATYGPDVDIWTLAGVGKETLKRRGFRARDIKDIMEAATRYCRTPATIGYDLSNSPDKSAYSLRQGARHLCELHEGDVWAVFKGYVVIVNPNRPPRMVDAQGREHELIPADKD